MAAVCGCPMLLIGVTRMMMGIIYFLLYKNLLKLSNRFSVLETDTLDVGQQNQVLLKHECKKVKSIAKVGR